MAESFPGLISDADPSDIPEGASVSQDNIRSFLPGRLSVRRGIGKQTQLMGSAGTFLDDDIIALYKYPHANGDFVVSADRAGNVKTRRDSIINTIATGRFADALWSFARDRRGWLFGINGRERGFWWDGESATVDQLGVDAPTTAPTVTVSAGGGGASAGDYDCYYRYVSKPAEAPVYSNLSPVFTVTAAANDTFVWGAIGSSAQSRVIGVQYWRSLVDDPSVLYLVSDSTNSLQIDANGLSQTGPDMDVYFPLRHNFSVNDSITISGSAADDGTYTITAVVDANTVRLGGVTWSTTAPGTSAFSTPEGLAADTLSDQALIDAALADPDRVMPLVDANGDPVANRFTPPPDWKHSIAKFQDRMFYGADNLDGVDEITTTAGGATVTYTDLFGGFTIPSNAVGSVLWFPGPSGWTKHIIESIDSPTTVSVYPVVSFAATTTGHAQRPEEGERNVIYYSEPDEPESVPVTNTITIQEQSEDEDEIVGLHAFGAYLYILKQRHIYSFSFARQPKIDGQARLITHRGAFNKNCWAVYEGQAYVMDQSGAYILSLSGDFAQISDPIQDYFRDGTVDFAKAKWFFVSCDYNSAVVRFHVSFTGDTGDRPRRALCYSIRHKTWWTESYPFALSGTAMAIVENRPQLLCGGQADIVVNLEKQETDMVATEIRGTVSSSTDTSLTDNTANFTDEVIGAPIGILTGDGRCQVRTILSRTGTTTVNIGDPSGTDLQFETQGGTPLDFQDGTPWDRQATVTAIGAIGAEWETNPELNDAYMIGAIGWIYRSKQHNLVQEKRKVKHNLDVNFLPTDGDYDIDVRMFFNEDAYTASNYASLDRGDGVTAVSGDDYEVISTDKNRSPRGNRVGDSRVTFSTNVDKRTQGRRRVTIELKGLKGDAPMAIDALDLSAE